MADKNDKYYMSSAFDLNRILIKYGHEEFLGYDLMIDRLSKLEDVVIEGECNFIAVVKGSYENILDNGRSRWEASLVGSTFRVEHRRFIEHFKRWYDVKRIGREWYAGNQPTTAAWIRERIQAALLPYGIPARERTELYKTLQTSCADFADTIPPLTLVTAEDLKQEYKRPPFIVESILCAGLTVLAAPPKTGKSFMVLDLACAVAEGRPFWGLHTEQGSVLYLDLEGTEWRTQDRLPKVGRASKSDCPAALTMAYGKDGDVRPIDAGLIGQLTTWIDSAQDPRIIIIDTLIHVKGRAARNEDAYAADTRFMKPLHDLAISKGIAIIAVTHTRKQNGFVLDDPFEAITGSYAQFGNSDTGWMICGKRADNKQLFLARGRDFEPVSFEIERTSSGRWKCNGTSEEMERLTALSSYMEDPFVRFLKAYLPKCGGRWTATANDIMTAIAQETGKFLETDAIRMSKRIRDIMPQLLENDHIVTIAPEGGGRKGRKFTFEQKSMTN